MRESSGSSFEYGLNMLIMFSRMRLRLRFSDSATHDNAD